VTAALWWHPRTMCLNTPSFYPDKLEHGDPSERVSLVQYVDPSEPIYVDEAQVTREEVAVEREFADAATTSRADAEAALVDELVDEVLQVPKKDRLRVAWPTGPLLDPAARERAGERI